MCRHAAYLGSPVTLHKLLFEPDHNLEKQAWQPRELREAVLNADGFGVGWYNDNKPASYRQPIPVWNDPNLRDFSKSLTRRLWLAGVRSATPGLGTHYLNTQPYHSGQWVFMHNGYILDFASTLRCDIRQTISTSLEAAVHGNTDSEYLFALFLHFHDNLNDTIAAIHATFKFIDTHIGNGRALLNLLMSDGKTLYATCHAINGECPSLYHIHSHQDFPQNSHIIASERFDQRDDWQAIEKHSIITAKPNIPATQTPI